MRLITRVYGISACSISHAHNGVRCALFFPAYSPSYWYAKHDNRRGPIHFYNRDDQYYEFTNFYPASICLDGKTWPTSEHYFQAQKFTGTPYVEQIRLLARPRQAFDLSRNPSVSRWRRIDWEDIKLHVMYKALLAKFTQHDELRKLLLLTRERELVEHTPYDSFWGDGGDGSGLNHLGKMLMKIRSQLRGEKKSAEVKPSGFSPSHGLPTANQPQVVHEKLNRRALGEKHCIACGSSTGSGQLTQSQDPGENSMEDAPSFYKSENEPTSAVNIVPFTPNSQQPPYSSGNQQPPYSSANQQPPFSSGNQQPPFSSGNQQPPFSSGNQQPPFSSGNQQPPFSSGNQQPPFSSGNQQPPFSSGNQQPPYLSTAQQPPYSSANQQPQHSQKPLSSQHLAQGVRTGSQELSNPEHSTATAPSAGQFQPVDTHSSNPAQLPGNSNDLTTPGCSLASHQASCGQSQSHWVVETPGCLDSSRSKTTPGFSHSGPSQTEEPMQIDSTSELVACLTTLCK